MPSSIFHLIFCSRRFGSFFACLFATCLVFCAGSQKAEAGSYFVSPSGNDGSAGTVGAPFQTISKALSVAQAGDYVELRSGTYREAINPQRSGTAQSPITIEAYNGESVTVSACDVVPGPWTAQANGIYTATATGALPASFWNPPGTTANGSQFVEYGGGMLATIVNESGSGTRAMTSAAPDSSWNFFAQATTWKVRGLSISSTGSTVIPGANCYAWFSINSPLTANATTASNAYAADDAATVRFDGSGEISLYLKKGVPNSLGTKVQALKDSTVNGYDLTLGPASGGNVTYTLTVKRSTGVDTTFTGTWAISQADWNDGGNGSTSNLQILAQENASPSPNLNQQFTLTVGSYEVTSASGTILQDLFDDGNLATVDQYPSGVSANISTGCNQVFVDGVMQQEARQPNYGAGGMFNGATANVTVTSTTAATPNRVTSATFGGKTANFYANARFVGGVGSAWSWQNAVVLNSSNSTLTLDPATESSWWWPDQAGQASQTGAGYVFGLPGLLDADGEWHFAPSTSLLSLRITGAANPTGHLVEVKRRNWCVNINGLSYITVRGIKTVGGAIQMNGAGNVLANCDAGYLSHFLTFSSGSQRDGGTAQGGGVILDGSGATVKNCVIHDTAGPAISTKGSGHVITRNTIYNANYSGIFTGGVVLDGDGEMLTFNTVHDCGRDVIEPNGTGSTILFNDVYGSGKLCKDLGVIYSSHTNAQGASGNKTRIAYNWVHDGNLNDPLSKGIYLDNFDRNFQVDHNVIWNFFGTSVSTALQDGIHMNSPADGHELYHNTLFNCGAYNESSYNAYPPSSDPYWTDTNQHLLFIAQNNLVLSDSGASLENAAGYDFRPKAGTAAVDPSTVSGNTTWTTANGTTNVPATFSFNPGSWKGTFTYTETTGQGVPVPTVNAWVPDGKPDSGALERGIAAWTAGVDGWEGIQQDPPPSVIAITATLQGVRISVDGSAVQTRVYYGTTDGGTNPAAWTSISDLGTVAPGDVISVFRPTLTGLAQNTTYYARFRSTNASGDTWSGVQSFTSGSIQTPLIVTPPTASAILVGQSLASSTLTGGSANVPGTFAWTTPATVPSAGTNTYSVTFTPTDSLNYTSATVMVAVTAWNSWTGNGSNTNWSSSSNWGGAAPVAGSALIFSGTARATNVNDLAADTAISEMKFNNTTSGQAFTVSGNRITLAGNITTAAVSSGSITDNSSIAMILSGNRSITTNTNHNLTINGLISDGGVGYGITKAGNGTLTLGNAYNSFSGNITINAGSLIFSTTNGTNSISNNITDNGTLTFSGAGNWNAQGPIAGAGAVQATGSGVATLSNSGNTFSGQIAVYSGSTLTVTSGGALGSGASLILLGTSGSDGVLNYAGSTDGTTGRTLKIGNTNTSNGTARINIVSTGNLTFTAASFVMTQSGFTTNRTLTLGGNGTGVGTIQGTIINSSGNSTTSLIKADSGKWILSGNNTYTGTTTINAGTLSLSKACLANAANVAISTGAAFNLSFSGADTIAKLLIDGVEQYQGTWGGIASNAANKTSLITGNGTLNVTAGPLTPYATWALAKGLDNSPGKESALSADPDADGLVNLLEWILGGDPLVCSTVPLPQASSDGSSLSLTFNRAVASQTTSSLFAEWSTDLAAWNSVAIGASSSGPNANGVTISINGTGTGADQVIVRVPLSNSIQGRLFLRTRATSP